MHLTFLRSDPVGEQLAAIRQELEALDRLERNCGLPPLAEQDLDRVFEIERRTQVLTTMTTHAGRRGVLLAIAAHALAGLLAEDAAELADPFSGDEVDAA